VTLHPALLHELLDAEIAVAMQRLGSRVAGIRRDGHVVQTPVTAPDGRRAWLSLDGRHYDAEPFSVSMVDDGGSTGSEVWPPALLGGIHPVFRRPFVCVRGCAEYYTHPSHFQDRWDASRNQLRLADLLDHLLRKAGAL
jgi:hypothetical protein